MTADEKRPTLADAKKLAQARTETSRPSDFLSEEEKAKLKQAASAKRKKRKKYTATDAVLAEIIARFGYDAYKAWANDEISMDAMSRYLAAERAREKRALLSIEAIIVSVGTSCAQPRKRGTPKGLKMAFNILKEEERKAGDE